DGFGNATETQPANGDRYKWTGRELDAETGFQFNRARFLDLHSGRWTSTDPLGYRAGDGNLYRYVFNTVTSYLDPLGLQKVTISAYDYTTRKTTSFVVDLQGFTPSQVNTLTM